MKDMSAFEWLGIAPRFFIDPKELSYAYRRQQRLYHPDSFVCITPIEREGLLFRSSSLSDAYRALVEPMRRLDELCKHIKADLNQDLTDKVFIEQVFQWKSERQDTPQEAEDLIRREYERVCHDLESAFQGFDLLTFSKCVQKARYLYRLIQPLNPDDAPL